MALRPPRSGMFAPTEREKDALPEPPSHHSSPEVPAPGEIFAGKYVVERILGRGGMGVVLAARHVELGQRVAVKFMLAEISRNADAAERFLREARAVVALTSEHVVRVLDVGRLDTGAPYMVMEYLAGEDLARLLRRSGPPPIGTAVDLVLQVCDALAEAHALGIVHRDLKPANLFVTTRRDGSPLVKVLDFGISKAGGLGESPASESLTESGVVMGSPAYMSPEQVRNSKGVDARSDVWSLGVILYELLTGISPFLGETIGATFEKIVMESPRPLRELRPDVPVGLAQIVERCLERRADARIDSVVTLTANLAEFATSDAAVQVERIARVASAPRADLREPTLVAPDRATSGARTVSYGSKRVETSRAWLRSARQVPLRPTTRWLIWALAGIALMAAGSAGTVWLRVGPRAAASAAAAITAATAIAPPQPSAVVVPQSDPVSNNAATPNDVLEAGATTLPRESKPRIAGPPMQRPRPSHPAGPRAIVPHPVVPPGVDPSATGESVFDDRQ